MEGAGGIRGPRNANRKVISNAYKLFDVLHDDTIQAKDKLPKITKVLNGDDVDINFPDEHDIRNTLLHGAVSYGFVYVVKLLLEYKADVNSKNADGETPLHLVLSDKRVNKNKLHKPIIQILLGHKADVNVQNLVGDTFLHLAVRQEKIPIIRLLVGKADATIQNIAGVTPLDLAKEKNNKVINGIFYSSFNKPDPMLHDECHPDHDNNADFADISVAKDANQAEQVADAFTKLAQETSKQEINDIVYSGFNKPEPVPHDEVYPVQDNSAGFADISVAKDANQAEQVADAFADLKDKYAASGAKHSIHGTVYQLCLLMVFSLRAFRLGYSFRLGTEVDEAEQFDDIVFKFQHPQSGKIKSLFVQAKHKANSNKGLTCYDLLAQGNKAQFSLLKYFKSFVKITQAIGQEASEIDFVICTNTHFEFDELCKLIGDNITLSLEIVTDVPPTFTKDSIVSNVYQGLFKEGKCYKLVTDDETVKLLQDYFDTLYKAELSSFKDGNSKQAVEIKIDDVENTPDWFKTESKEVDITDKNMEEQCSVRDCISLLQVETVTDSVKKKSEGWKTEGKEVMNKNTAELNVILTYLNDGISFKTFLNNLTIVVKHEVDNELVKTEFRTQSKTNLLDTDLLTDAFYKKIFAWFSSKEGMWLKHETIEKMIESITGIINTFASSGISRVYAENFLISPFKFNKDKLIELHGLMSEYRFVNVATSMESKLTLAQVAQAIEQSGSYVALDSYMFIRVSSLLPCGNDALTVDAFKSPGKHNLLVIDCLSKTEKVSQRELTTLGNKLLAITADNPQKKLVIIAPEKHVLAEMFSLCSGYYKHTATIAWKDFTNETQDILLATQVDFQGQLVELNQVIDKTETELLEIVPLDTLIHEGLVIGTELPTSIGYNECFYIDRSVNYVNQVVLKADMVEDKSKKKLRKGFTKTESDFKNLCEKNSGANIHLIEKQGDRYIWVKSQGELKSLRHYVDYTDYCQSCSEAEFLKYVKQQRVVIISDLAGKGKSTVLARLSNIIKAKHDGTLVFMIDLNSHTKLWENHKSTIFDNTGALKFLCKEIILMKTPLEKALFERKYKVVLLFDGFDEISPDYEKTVLGLIQNLIEATEAQIWITTRPFMQEKLEDKLRQWSSSLGPFSQQNQVDYLTKYWKHMKNIKDSKEGRIKDFALSLVSQFARSISDKEREFTGIPLQMKMLAECFVDDFDKSLDFKTCYNLVDLYHTFIEKKFNIYHVEKNKTDRSKIGTKHIQNLFFDSCIIQHRYLALSMILSEEKFAFLLPDYTNVIDSDEKIYMINKIGIVHLSNGTPHFIHRTFAEYCVAEYFMELLKDTKCMSPNLKSFVSSELLIRNNYAVVRSFLNGLLAKYQPATSTLSEYPNHLFTRDDMNTKYKGIQVIFVRTAIEGNNHICIYLLNDYKGKDEEVLKLLQGNEPDVRMLNIAAENNNYKFIESLLQWALDYTGKDQETVKRTLKACASNGKTSLHSASAAGHNDVVQTLMQWTRDNLEQGQETVKQMLQACASDGETSLHTASEAGRNDVVHTLLQWTGDNLEQGQEAVKQMLEACDSNGKTSLHSASAAGHSDVVQTLLQWTRDNLEGGQEKVKQMLEACDRRGWNSLHCASEAGHCDVVEALLQWTRDNLNDGQGIVKRMLEACNRTGWTSLHWASMSGRNEVVQTLLKWTLDNLGGGQEIVNWMLKACDSKGWTSLHRASMSGHIAVVQTLLQYARDNLGGDLETVKWMLMASDSNGNTSLHLASVLGHSDVVVTLLQWIKTLDNGVERVRLILFSVDGNGRTVLGQLANYDLGEMPHRLLQWTLDNMGEETLRELLLTRDCDGRTALELSREQSHRYDCEKIVEWATGNSYVNLREHITALKNKDQLMVYTC